MKHTPGPWQVRSKQMRHLHQVGIVNHGNFRALANTCGDNAVANARLIAAAPELLEACKMALAQVVQDNDERKAEHRGTEHQLRAALAKAE